MKICMMTPRISTSPNKIFAGGLVNSLMPLIKGLSERHDISVVSGVPTSEYYELNENDFPCSSLYRFKINSNPSTLRYGFNYLVKSITSIKNAGYNYDIIHGLSGFSIYSICSGLTKRIYNLPTVHTIYCPIVKDDKNQNNLLGSPGLIKLSLSYIDKIIAISNNVAESIKSIGINSKKIEIIPPAIDTDKFSPHSIKIDYRKKLALNNKLTILFVGNLSKNKGLDVLLYSLQKVVKMFPSLKLIITTEFKTKQYELRKKEINQTIETLNIGEHIIKLGFVDRIQDLIAACDVLVVPFRNTDGPTDYPLAVLEGMAMSRPIISTDVGGINEIIKDNETGFIIEKENPEHLSDKLVDVLKNKKLRIEIGNKARDFVKKNFSIKKITSMTEDIYNELLNI